MTHLCTAVKRQTMLILQRLSNQIFILLWKGKTWDNVESSDTVGNVGSNCCQDHSAILLLFNLRANTSAVTCVCHLRMHSIMCTLTVCPQRVIP